MVEWNHAWLDQKNAAAPPGMRYCSGHRTFIPADGWKAGRKDKPQYCTPCYDNYTRAKAYRKQYGIALDDYDRMLDDQDGRCAICRCVPRTKRLAVDHDHDTGEVRGLLCRGCNYWLAGRVSGRDPVAVLERALEYLRNPPARALGLRGSRKAV
jgi:hypothetical protein